MSQTNEKLHSLRELGQIRTYRIGHEQAVTQVYSLSHGSFVVHVPTLLKQGFAPVSVITSVYHKNPQEASTEGHAGWQNNEDVRIRLHEVANECTICIRPLTRTQSNPNDEFRTPRVHASELIRVPFHTLVMTRTEGWAFRDHLTHMYKGRPGSDTVKVPFRKVETEYLRHIISDMIEGITISGYKLSDLPSRVTDGLYVWLEGDSPVEATDQNVPRSVKREISQVITSRVGFGMEDGNSFFHAASIETFNPSMELDRSNMGDVSFSDLVSAMSLVPFKSRSLEAELDDIVFGKTMVTFAGPGGETQIKWYRAFPLDPLSYQVKPSVRPNYK